MIYSEVIIKHLFSVT